MKSELFMHKMNDILIDIQKQAPVDTKYRAGRWHRDRATFRGLWVEMKVYGKSLISPQNKDVKKFLIIGRARSGTTLLSKLLDAHNQIECNGEVLHSMVLRPTDHLNRLAMKSKSSIYGAKLLSYQMVQVHRLQDPIGFLKQLNYKGFKLIYIRRSTFAQTLSLDIAQMTKAFHNNGDMEKKQSSFYIDPQDFLRRIIWSDMLLQYEQYIFNDIPHFTISYEQDLMGEANQHKMLHCLFEYLDVEPEITSSKLKKMLSSDPREVIKNYDQIANTLQTAGYGHLL